MSTSSPLSLGAAEVMALSRQVMDLVLAADLQPVDEELVALSQQLCATPDLETFDKLYGEGRDPTVVSNRQKKLRDALVLRMRKRLGRLGRSEADTDKVQQLLGPLAGKLPVGEGDWFCSSCSGFNFVGVKQCKECGTAKGGKALTVLQPDLAIQEAYGVELLSPPAGRRGGNQGRPAALQRGAQNDRWSRSAPSSRPAREEQGGGREPSREPATAWDTWRPDGASSSSSSSRQGREEGIPRTAPREARLPLFMRGGTSSSRDEEQEGRGRPWSDRGATGSSNGRQYSSSSSRTAAVDAGPDASPSGERAQEGEAGPGRRWGWDGEVDERQPALVGMNSGPGRGGRSGRGGRGGRSSGGRGSAQRPWEKRGHQSRR
jgi:hypothetical protein